VPGKRHVGDPSVPDATSDERPHASWGRGPERQKTGWRKGLPPGAKHVAQAQPDAWTQEHHPRGLERHQVSVAACPGDPTGRQLSGWARAQSCRNQGDAVLGKQFEVDADARAKCPRAAADDHPFPGRAKACSLSERAHLLEQHPRRCRTSRRRRAGAACAEQQGRGERDDRAPRRSSPPRAPDLLDSVAPRSGCRLDVRA